MLLAPSRLHAAAPLFQSGADLVCLLPVVSPLAPWVERLLRFALSRLPALVNRRLALGCVVRARRHEPAPERWPTLPADRGWRLAGARRFAGARGSWTGRTSVAEGAERSGVADPSCGATWPTPKRLCSACKFTAPISCAQPRRAPCAARAQVASGSAPAFAAPRRR